MTVGQHKSFRKGLRSAVAWLLVAALLLPAGSMMVFAEEDTTPTEQQEQPAPASQTSYVEYLKSHADKAKGGIEFSFSAAENYETDSPDVKVVNNYLGVASALHTTDEGKVTWTFEVPKTGLYNLKITYSGSYAGRDGIIERTLYLDGKIPFDEVTYIRFSRVFVDVYDEQHRKDINGHDIRPKQQQVETWMTQPVKDFSGYHADPFMFYLTEGTHTITLESVREHLLISEFTFYNEKEVPTYAEVLKEYEAKGYKKASGDIVYKQAEDLYQKSDKSNYPLNDRSSAGTMPQDVYHIILNSLGGQKWQDPGSWVTWKVKVGETGLYKIVLRFRQNIYSGAQSSRKLTIDGEVPFKEAAELSFDYDTSWQSQALGTGTGKNRQEFLFYFEKDREYTIGLETVLGPMADILRRTQAVVDSLNNDYRKILMITGPSPEKYRQYYFEQRIPDVIEDFKVQSEELGRIIEEMESFTSQKGERVVQLDKVKYLLDEMVARPRDIAARFKLFKENLAGLGTWILSSGYQPLELDYLAFVPAEQKNPRANAGFFKTLKFGFESFYASFLIDYQSIGTTIEHQNVQKHITVWLSSGRDQSSIIRDLIDRTFTPDKHISVNLQLVTAGALLPSVLAGRGPDVALGMGNGDPINYAVRNAVKSIDHMEGFDEVIQRFHPSAMVPYTFNGKAYALPETQSFSMLFYRTDIFEELGIQVPKTWDELEQITKELQKKNMSVGLPHDLNALLMMMYQRGEPLYRRNGAETNLDTQNSVLAFTQLTNYFTLYKYPVDYDFLNRFRLGEIPIGIADYTLYNQLLLFAPEIRGQWAMTTVPGTPVTDENGNPVKDENGNIKINHANPAGGTAVMMLRGCKDEESAWEFMKWWTSAEIQASYGTQMETVMNSAARQPTANREALKMMSWSVKDYESIASQWDNVVGTPEVPGGYYTARIVEFAFNRVINNNEDPGDALQMYIEALNAELARKRAEFGLDDSVDTTGTTSTTNAQ